VNAVAALTKRTTSAKDAIIVDVIDDEDMVVCFVSNARWF
jgi:hypothetical protein